MHEGLPMRRTHQLLVRQPPQQRRRLRARLPLRAGSLKVEEGGSVHPEE